MGRHAGNIKVEMWSARRKACKDLISLDFFAHVLVSILLHQVLMGVGSAALSHGIHVAACRFVNAIVPAVVAISPHSM
jgi:hypothetical protein